MRVLLHALVQDVVCTQGALLISSFALFWLSRHVVGSDLLRVSYVWSMQGIKAHNNIKRKGNTVLCTNLKVLSKDHIVLTCQSLHQPVPKADRVKTYTYAAKPSIVEIYNQFLQSAVVREYHR